ncbi:Anti-sigma-factor antagonist [Candidatus Magnetomorum sp. HK-1]|nr:Anti-sigma-factor antagonist [Candidatus Magnetomorum sp. HK-1]
MFTFFQEDDYIKFKISSEVKMINKTIKEIRNYLNEYDVEEDGNIVLILRELINNAIEHGNNNNSELTISISISHLKDQRFKIVVEDEGKGFDYYSVNYRVSEDPTQIRNRGLSLVNSFSDEIDFNDIGNMITVYVTAKSETQFQINYDGDWTIVIPGGDITAEEAESFRSVMLKFLDEGRRKFRFDFSHVNDVDSIGLSLFVIFSNMAKKESDDVQLEIVRAKQEVIHLFQVTRLNRIYKIIE